MVSLLVDDFKYLNLGLKVFARVEQVARVEGAFDLGVEMTEGRGGGCFPPRFLG